MTSSHPVQVFTSVPLSGAAKLRFVYGAEQLLAVVGIVVLMPAAVLVGAVILILSRRGPLVRHYRVGQYGAPLAMLKFRTMWSAAEPRSRFRAVEDISGTLVPGSKCGNDSRVSSRFAAFCRRYSVDELPQLYHVARGEMSLVGPRPLTARELAVWYGASAGEILALRPGLTGLWQVYGRNRLTYPQRRRLDLFLARRASPGLYFRILLRSVPKVIAGTDAS